MGKIKWLHRVCLVVLVAAVTLPCGCGVRKENTAEGTPAGQSPAPASQEADPPQEITFQDDLGREVTVCNPKRVAVLIGSFADIWLLSGGEVAAAVEDSWDSLNLELGEDAVNLGSILEPDVERLIAAEPDFVIASSKIDAHLALEDTLSGLGIAVAYFDVSDFDAYLHVLEICTNITGQNDLYEKNGLAVKEEIRKVKERVDGSAPTVLYLRASSTDVKAKGSSGSVCGEMLEDLGCMNIADSDGSLLDELGMEAIVEADPEYIFVTVQGNDTDAAMKNIEQQLTSNPAWSSINAVKNKHYYVMDKRLFHLKPNARWGEAYGQLADILYPVD